MSKTRTTALLLVLAALIMVGSAGAQSSAAFVPEAVRDEAFDLSIQNIMRAEENVGVAPAQVRWSDDSEWVYFSWRPGDLPWDQRRALYRVRADGSGLEELTTQEADAVAPLIAGGDLSADRAWRVSSVGGDLYLVDRGSMVTRRLTHTEDSEGQPLFTADGEGVLFRRGNNLYRLDLADGGLRQVTRIADGPERGEDDEPEGHKAFLEEQQLELFEHIRRDKARADKREAENDAREALEPAEVHLGRGERVQGLQPTRSGAHVLVRAGKRATDAVQTIVPDWVTDDGYTQDLTVRTKVGDAQGTTRVGLLTTATGAMTWIEGVPEDYEGEGSPSIFGSGWNDAGTTAYIIVVSSDNKDRWIWSVDAATAERTLLDHLHDEAWIAGPCSFGCSGFLPDSDRFYFVSEETGYAHLYAINADGTDRQPLTQGNWEVLRLSIPEDRSEFRLSTNQGSPFHQHEYRLSFEGGELTALTEGDGRYVATPSPDGARAAVIHDLANRPPELFVASSDRLVDGVQVTDSPTATWASFPWLRPEIVEITAADGTMVPARIYRPADLGAEANGAGVIFVHGAGYLHNVHNYWSSYYREYQFNHFLAAAGYTVLDIDYRGSAGYGRDWRTAIYRWMGGKDLSDQVDGAAYLVEHEGVDAKRVGLYGGSYGGFITLMGLFTSGDTFKAGAALRSVTDWAHYNNGYTSRILNLPQDDEEAYEQSSPIYFAENFGPDQHLVMLHGMVDTNVHFSDVVRLAQRLIELGKSNWEMAVYPVESHGFVEPASWTDEYRRIFELFERTLRQPDCTVGGALCDVRMGGE
jgi:dipeptidyl aminopeptidase/acylaminoacyl peptidase